MWFDAAASNWIGAIAGACLGAIGGLWGTLTGFSASKGNRRGLVLNTARVLIVAGACSLIAAGVAFFTGQPYHVWYPFLILGIWPTVFLPFMVRAIKKVYAQAERKKMAADDIE